MKQRRCLGKSTLIIASLALMIISLWEICVRLDAMYTPVKMFFSMASGEGIPLSSAMNYFDWTILESPLWLMGCILIALISIALSSRPKGGFFLLPAALSMALYGLTREVSFLADFWRLIQPALLLIISALSMLNLILLPFGRKRRRKDDSVPDFPRITDAPRLSRLHKNSHRRAG